MGVVSCIVLMLNLSHFPYLLRNMHDSRLLGPLTFEEVLNISLKKVFLK